MIRMFLYGGAGLVAGYALSRAMEARANGLPMDVAFKLQSIMLPAKRLAEARRAGQPLPTLKEEAINVVKKRLAAVAADPSKDPLNWHGSGMPVGR